MSREVIGRLKHNLAVSTVSADNENYQVSLTIKDAREALALLEAEQHREASHEQPEYLESLLHQACDIIDRLTAENERLKDENVRLKREHSIVLEDNQRIRENSRAELAASKAENERREWARGQEYPK